MVKKARLLHINLVFTGVETHNMEANAEINPTEVITDELGITEEELIEALRPFQVLLNQKVNELRKQLK